MKQHGLDNVLLRVIIVDNDVDKSAYDLVEMMKGHLPFPILYDIEPKRGISYARNRLLKLVKAEYLAFIDDDEFVDQVWLSSLLSAMQDYDADVIFGPVISILPDNAPHWAKIHGCFNRPNKSTGQRMWTGGGGNVLVKKTALGEPRLLFNPDFAFTGGEDTEFFYKLHQIGKTMIWCDEAIVYENVEPNRLKTKWVYNRAFRGGQCYVRIRASVDSRFKKIIRIANNLTRLFSGFILLPFVYMISYSQYVRLRSWIYSTIGQLTAHLGSTRFYQEYTD